MKWLKVGAVIFGALVITALGVDAADTFSGSRSTMLGELISAKDQSTCPSGMVAAPMGQTYTCVDRFEASAGPRCQNQEPQNERQSQDNVNDAECDAVSKAGAHPWVFITREQAAAECIKAGKRLPTSDEWYLMSVGTPDDPAKCNIGSSEVNTSGADSSCISAIGTQDAIGNVWEWVTDDVIDNQYHDRALPASGYVTQVDANGVATRTDVSTSSDLFYKDYFWANNDNGAYGMIRGGFYGSKTDAGIYSIHADTVPTTSGTAIGFRCVK